MDSFLVSRSRFRAHRVSPDAGPNVLQDTANILTERLWAGLWASDFGLQTALSSGGGRVWVERSFAELCELLLADTAACRDKVQRTGKVPEALSRLWFRVAFATMNSTGCDLPGMIGNVLQGRSAFEPISGAPRQAVRTVLEKIFSEQALTPATLNEILALCDNQMRAAA